MIKVDCDDGVRFMIKPVHGLLERSLDASPWAAIQPHSPNCGSDTFRN